MSGKSRWDGLAALYDTGMAPLEKWPMRAWRDRVRRALADALEANGKGAPGLPEGRRPPRVLEVGAGTGRNRLPDALGARVVAVDRSLDMLRRARDRGYRSGVVADAGALPFPDGVFEAGGETLVWCEVERPVEALAEVRRVLADGARFVMLDHVRPPGVLGPVADALSRVTGPWMDEWWNRDTRRYVRPAGFRLLGSRDDLGGAVRTLLLKKPTQERTPDDETEPITEGRP